MRIVGYTYRADHPVLPVFVGELASWDSFAGIIPCRVVNRSGSAVRITLTADRYPYSRGESFDVRATSVVARAAVYVRGGMYRIRGGSEVVAGPREILPRP